jgi:hypothetical protein
MSVGSAAEGIDPVEAAALQLQKVWHTRHSLIVHAYYFLYNFFNFKGNALIACVCANCMCVNSLLPWPSPHSHSHSCLPCPLSLVQRRRLHDLNVANSECK